MILEAAEKLALDLSRSWVIGDAPRDIEAGKAAGCRTILFKDPSLALSVAAREPGTAEPDAVVGSLHEATDVIAREALMEHAGPAEEPAPAPARLDAAAPIALNPLNPAAALPTTVPAAADWARTAPA